MNISDNVATRTAKFFDDMIAQEHRVTEFANRFISDILNNVSPAASQLTMEEFKNFRADVLGEIDSFSAEELRELNHLTYGVSIINAGSVVQNKYNEYRKMIERSEEALFKAYGINLPDTQVFDCRAELRNRNV